jgi:hypothetical protein
MWHLSPERALPELDFLLHVDSSSSGMKHLARAFALEALRRRSQCRAVTAGPLSDNAMVRRLNGNLHTNPHPLAPFDWHADYLFRPM